MNCFFVSHTQERRDSLKLGKSGLDLRAAVISLIANDLKSGFPIETRRSLYVRRNGTRFNWIWGMGMWMGTSRTISSILPGSRALSQLLIISFVSVPHAVGKHAKAHLLQSFSVSRLIGCFVQVKLTCQERITHPSTHDRRRLRIRCLVFMRYCPVVQVRGSLMQSGRERWAANQSMHASALSHLGTFWLAASLLLWDFGCSSAFFSASVPRGEMSRPCIDSWTGQVI